MKGFFGKVGKDIQKAVNSNQKNSKNIRGGGQSLGGTKPGKLIPNICVTQTGSLGVKLENTAQNHAIIADVTPGGIAESLGLQRGDIICHPGTNGANEIEYKEFLSMVKSNSRPLTFDVRRTASLPQQHPSNNNKQNLRADADARRQAVIAAAEERNTKNRDRKRPIAKRKGGKVIAELTSDDIKRLNLQKEENIKRNEIEMANKPLSKEAQMAIQAAKKVEAQHSSQLGYNPYEARKVSAGQASSASVAMAHGSINAENAPSNIQTSSSNTIPSVRPPPEAMKPVPEKSLKNINHLFDEALNTVMTSNPSENVPKSLRIMRKLIANATTSPPNDPKRQVRITDPNKLIKSSIIDMDGAVELMMSVGFVITDVDEKMVLNFDESVNGGAPSWLNDALKKMEQCEIGK